MNITGVPPKGSCDVFFYDNYMTKIVEVLGAAKIRSEAKTLNQCL